MFKFIGNDTIVIMFLGIGFIIGVVTKQDIVTSTTAGALAGFIGAKAVS